MGVVCQIASSCSEYLNLIHVLLKIAVDFYRFLLIDNNQLNYFFSNFNLHRFSISIDDNQWIKSVDFRFRFLSVNYAWHKYRLLLLQNFEYSQTKSCDPSPSPPKKWILMISGPRHFMVVTGRSVGCYPVLLSFSGLGEKRSHTVVWDK